MFIYLISLKGTPESLRVQVRDWKRSISVTSSLNWYVVGVGFERPFDEFQPDFQARRDEIVSLLTKVNRSLIDRLTETELKAIQHGYESLSGDGKFEHLDHFYLTGRHFRKMVLESLSYGGTSS